MAKARGTSKTGPGLSLVGGDQRSSEDAELVELREALAAVGCRKTRCRWRCGARTPRKSSWPV